MMRTGIVTESLNCHPKWSRSGKISFHTEKHRVHPTLWVKVTKDLGVILDNCLNVKSQFSAIAERTNVIP